MADQIVITEKSSQAKDVRAAVGSRYGEILAAEGHLFDLLERRRDSPRGQGQLGCHVRVDRLKPKREAPQERSQNRLQAGRVSCASIAGHDEFSETQS
jgi:DNA topoisomerase III